MMMEMMQSKDDKGMPGGALKPDWGSLKDNKDDLDLSGVLNVLDGVVDCPDRIVIMTTNHPEKLDPALIRPGRINLKIYLGFVECQEAMNMCEHYFGGYKGNYFTPHQKKEFEKTWEVLRVPSGGRLNLTPAQLEQLCAENDSLDELCAAIHKIADTVNFRESAALSRKESKSGK